MCDSSRHWYPSISWSIEVSKDILSIFFSRPTKTNFLSDSSSSSLNSNFYLFSLLPFLFHHENCLLSGSCFYEVARYLTTQLKKRPRNSYVLANYCYISNFPLLSKVCSYAVVFQIHGNSPKDVRACKLINLFYSLVYCHLCSRQRKNDTSIHDYIWPYKTNAVHGVKIQEKGYKVNWRRA